MAGKVTKIGKSVHLVVCCLILQSCSLKSKTELHIELGLNYLNNTKFINTCIEPDLCLKQIGFIVDKTKQMVLQFENNKQASFNDYVIYAEINNYKSKEKKSIKLDNKWFNNDERNYMVSDFEYDKNIIDSLKVIFYRKREKRELMLLKKVGFKRVRTNNT